MKLVILGCGRVGVRLAQLMEEAGHELSVIDADPSSLEKLPQNFRGQVVLGTGIDVDVLKAAGIEKADAFAAVTNYDNTNIMACQVAKEIFGIKKVLARIYDPGREGLYHQLGLETICPTTLISTAAQDILMTPQSFNTGPLRVDTTQDVVAVAAALAEGVADYDKEHVHAEAGDNPVIPPAQSGDDTADPQNGRARRSLFRH